MARMEMCIQILDGKGERKRPLLSLSVHGKITLK